MTRNEIPTIVCKDPEGREARIARNGDGTPLGAAIFLTIGELTVLGVDAADADNLVVRIEEGEICIEAADG